MRRNPGSHWPGLANMNFTYIAQYDRKVGARLRALPKIDCLNYGASNVFPANVAAVAASGSTPSGARPETIRCSEPGAHSYLVSEPALVGVVAAVCACCPRAGCAAAGCPQHCGVLHGEHLYFRLTRLRLVDSTLRCARCRRKLVRYVRAVLRRPSRCATPPVGWRGLVRDARRTCALHRLWSSHRAGTV